MIWSDDRSGARFLVEFLRILWHVLNISMCDKMTRVMQDLDHTHYGSKAYLIEISEARIRSTRALRRPQEAMIATKETPIKADYAGATDRMYNN